MNVNAWLEYKLTYFEATAQHTGTPHLVLVVCLMFRPVDSPVFFYHIVPLCKEREFYSGLFLQSIKQNVHETIFPWSYSQILSQNSISNLLFHLSHREVNSMLISDILVCAVSLILLIFYLLLLLHHFTKLRIHNLDFFFCYVRLVGLGFMAYQPL